MKICYIKVNGIVKAKQTMNESNIDLDDSSKHSTFQIGHNANSSYYNFYGFMKNIILYQYAFNSLEKHLDSNY